MSDIREKVDRILGRRSALRTMQTNRAFEDVNGNPISEGDVVLYTSNGTTTAQVRLVVLERLEDDCIQGRAIEMLGEGDDEVSSPEFSWRPDCLRVSRMNREILPGVIRYHVDRLRACIAGFDLEEMAGEFRDSK